MSKEVGCKRTGKCCQRLVVGNTEEYTDRMMEYTDKAREEANLTDEFVEGWRQAALLAAQAGRSVFTCPFLSEEHVCMLQDNKPEICSSSLSEETMNTKDKVKAGTFFHPTCGWAADAPDDLIEVLELRDKAYMLDNDHPNRKESEDAYLLADEVYAAQDKQYRIRDNKWQSFSVKEESACDETAEPVKDCE